MIPSARTRKDQACQTFSLFEVYDAGNNASRVHIPPADIAQLSESRRKEYTRRARKEHNTRLLKWEQTISKVYELRDTSDVDEGRPYGLPQGEAIVDVWGKILDWVQDLKEIRNIRDTCILFRDILEQKYETLKLTEVVVNSGLTSRFGGQKTLLTLRQVCKSTKAVVDQWIKNDRLDYRWNFEAIGGERGPPSTWVHKPKLLIEHTNSSIQFLQSVVSSLELQNVPRCSFPVISRLCLCEWLLERGDIISLRISFQRLLQLIGSNVRSFQYRSSGYGYDRLRTWMQLMPNVEELIHRAMGLVGRNSVYEEPLDRDHEFPMEPFPACQTLRRFCNDVNTLPAAFYEKVFVANPGIKDVFLSVGSPDYSTNEEFERLLRSLGNLQQVERLYMDGSASGRNLFLELRFAWPLKSLTLTATPFLEQFLEGFSSRTLFNFINAFCLTLEEVTVTWKIRDTGGYLDLPMVRNLLWKLWPSCRTLEFMMPLGSLQYLDIDVADLWDINGSVESTNEFINDMNLPPLFPALKQIRTRREQHGDWLQVSTA